MFLRAPPSAAWRHEHARRGFEVAYFQAVDDGWRIDGCTTALEDDDPWVVTYAIELGETWTTGSAQITGRSAAGPRAVALETDGAGHWLVDGEVASELDGCLDVDLESSAMTNAMPIHRMALPVGAAAAAPAAYVRALDLTVERLEQSYARIADETSHQRYDYTAPAFDVSCRLVYDESGLLLDYPGLAVRAG